MECLFLVVNDTDYHSTVPVLIGTNILSMFLKDTRDRFAVRFLQKTCLYMPWYLAFRCMTLRERELSHRSHVLALVRSEELKPITIRNNCSIVVNGYLYDEVPYHPVFGMLTPTRDSSISNDLDIEPSVLSRAFRQ